MRYPPPRQERDKLRRGFGKLELFERFNTYGFITHPILSPLERVRVRLFFSGDYREGETPLPIPNREVKLLIADGTTTARLWESRSLPGIYFKASVGLPIGALLFYGSS